MAVAGTDDQSTHPLWCEANAACFKAACTACCFGNMNCIYVGTY